MRSLKFFFLLMAIGLLLGIKPQVTKAQTEGDLGGKLGIGLMLGEPSGASVKYWNSNFSAFNVGAAWSLGGGNEALHLHADFLLHSWFEDIEERKLAFYYGIGGRMIFSDDAEVGVRVPIGLNYVFQTIPFDLFVEAVPILDLRPDVEFAGNGAVGIRYYF